MARTADAVVIGGGIVGASAFFHLCSLGLSRVVLCERRQPGAGASGASGAFIQFHFCRNPTETRLTFASLPYFTHWDELVGAGSSGFEPAGYLRLEPGDREDALRERVTMLRRYGVDTSVVSPEDVARLAPYLRIDDVSAAAYEPGSGYADSNQCIAGFLAAAQRMGGEVCSGTTVTAVRVKGGRVVGVDTSVGPIDTPLVVSAAGAWSMPLLSDLGLDLPVIGARTQWIGFAMDDIPDRMMTIGDGVSTSYFRQHGDRILIGLGAVARLPLGDLEANEGDIPADIVQLARERLADRLIGAESARPVGGRTGPITLTADDLPIVDCHPEVRGLHFFAGDCGSSFKTAPALGCALAEWAVLGQPAIADVSALSLSRFAQAAT